MREDEMWVIVDTETTGLRNPVYPVEIAAQRMVGWQPNGEPFRALLNFDVPIERMAEKIHGYSREFLRENGTQPDLALRSFAEYAGGLPLVSYNLAFDWNRVLQPAFSCRECGRLPSEGFCALSLTRHAIPDLPNFKLKTVITTFCLSEDQTHHAGDDVQCVVALFSRHLASHFSQVNILGFDRVSACSRGEVAVPPLTLPLARPKRRGRTAKLKPEEIFAIGQLNGICQMIMLDHQYTADELNFLAAWLEDCPHTGVEPVAKMFDLVRAIVADKVVTGDEKRQLTDSIQQLLSWTPPLK